MWISEVAICASKWIYLILAWISRVKEFVWTAYRRDMENKSDYEKWIEECMFQMACKLPAMIYSAPKEDEAIELDFGEKKQPSVRRKTRLKKEEKEETTKWSILPDILLEDIFSRLSIRERYNASQVCRNWRRIFYSKQVWNTFVLTDRTLTRRKFNYYMGDQYVLDHFRTQLCLHKVSRGFRRIVITPMENFYNLYEFMTILSYYCENYEALNLIRTLDFTFGCEFSADNSGKVFGTGGKMLQALKRLMDNLAGLKHLSLRDLLLEKEEARYFLDDVAYNCCETLRTLCLVNCSKDPFAMLHPTVFVNLHTLTLSPQHLSDDIVILLGHTKVKDLYLLQTKITPPCTPVSYKAWKEYRTMAPKIRVHHTLQGEVKTEIVWQEGAPVKTIVYDSPEKEVCLSSVYNISNYYCNTIEVLAFLGLPEYSLNDSFDDRADTPLMLLGKSSPFLDTLVIRDNISTATLLLLAHYCRNLRRLIVRKYSIIRKCDWPQNLEWTPSFYNWLRSTANSYESTVKEISKLLEIKWTPLTDEEFTSFRL